MWLNNSSQEELPQKKDADQDGSSLTAMEVAPLPLPLPSPSTQLLDQKFEESKREAVDEEWQGETTPSTPWDRIDQTS